MDDSLVEKARKALEDAIFYYQGRPVGTVAACDPDLEALNYDQCFIRDFVPAAIVFLTEGNTAIVRNFLEETLSLQRRERHLSCFQPSQGLMPASFKVGTWEGEGSECLRADFGDQAIGGVTPADACFWWIILLRIYVKATGDLALAHRPDFQRGIQLILELCLVSPLSMYPTMLVPDGSCMIDRRMGVYGYPLEIQALFYGALRAAHELLLPCDTNDCSQAVDSRLGHLIYHVREYYWLDLERLNQIYRYKAEEFGEMVVNKFNIYPNSIPEWLPEWIPETGGYLVGNLGPGQMDFRFFTLGNLIAVLVSLANEAQSQGIMDLIAQRWQDLIGHTPMKLCFPAITGQDWKTLTGADPKNAPWSYHNGGNWPFLLWLLTAAAQKTGQGELAHRAIEVAERRLCQDQWPEYYDGRYGRLIGKEARKYQTWTIAAYLVAKALVENPECLAWICFDDDPSMIACSV